MPREYRYQIGGAEEEERVSRSQKKRDSAALQAVGKSWPAFPP